MQHNVSCKVVAQQSGCHHEQRAFERAHLPAGVREEIATVEVFANDAPLLFDVHPAEVNLIVVVVVLIHFRIGKLQIRIDAYGRLWKTSLSALIYST